MTRRLSDQRGVTLPELLLAMTLSLIIMGGTLATFNQFDRNTRETQQFNQTLDQTRAGLEILARELRNLAKPGTTGSYATTAASIYRAQPHDFIFQTADQTRLWARYCLATSGTLAGGRAISPGAAVVWETISPSTTLPSGMTGACPGTGYGARRVVSDYVTNQRDGLDRPLFAYSCSTGTTCATTNVLQVKGVRADVYVDLEPRSEPAEQRVSTSIYLRNQNEPPVAEMTVRPGTTGSYTLNASGSDDPEGRTLKYLWFIDGTPTNLAAVCNGSTLPIMPAGANYTSGVTNTIYAPKGTTSSIRLAVCDPGGLRGDAGPTTVTFP